MDQCAAFVVAIQKDVREEFSSWNRKNSKNLLRSLHRDESLRASSNDHRDISQSHRLVTAQEYTSGWKNKDTLQSIYPSEIVTYNDGLGDTFLLVTQASCDAAPTMVPFPRYESCTPLATAIFKGDDDDNMPFIPFADDSRFDQDSCQEQYAKLLWERRRMDPEGAVQSPHYTALVSVATLQWKL